MKNLLLTLLFLVAAGTTFANNICVVSGTWERKNSQPVKLFRVEYGALAEVATSQLTGDNRFFFAFEPECEAFYVIGQNLGIAVNNYIFYFKPGDKLNVTVNADNSYTLTGENTPENKELARWHAFIAPLEEKSVYYTRQNSTYVDFFPLLEEKLNALPAFQPEYTGNPEFNGAFAALREYDLLFHALHYLRVPRSAHPQGEDYPDYYREISPARFTSSKRLLGYPYGMEILSAYQLTFLRFDNTSADGQKVVPRNNREAYEMTAEKMVNDTIRGEMTLLAGRSFKSYDALLAFHAKYGNRLVTGDQQQRMREIMFMVADNNMGQTAIDFKFPDLSGNEVALSDFKGKVVYIDVWAMWCAPCRKEIPALKALEEEYKGKDIVFMSVCTDKEPEHAKWKKFVADNELKGVQLFAGARENDISQPYRISGIPRFILVGKDGRLIASDAPRPSSDEIKIALEAALKK